MNKRVMAALPVARKKRLVVRALPEETLVYDLDTCRAHCLGPVVAAVWKRCDGRTGAARAAADVARETGMAVDEAAVWVAVGRLSAARLLETKVLTPGGRSRREWLAQAATLAGVTILSITAPLAVEAATCVANCSGTLQNPAGSCGAIPCCPPAVGLCCRQGAGRFCQCRTGDCSP